MAGRAVGPRGRGAELVAIGRTNPEIASLLAISAKTVQHHVSHVFDKLGVASRAGVALRAIELGLLAQA